MKKNYKHSLLVLELRELQSLFNFIMERTRLAKKRMKISYMSNDTVEHKRAIETLKELKVLNKETTFWIYQHKDKIKNCQRKERFYGMARSR